MFEKSLPRDLMNFFASAVTQTSAGDVYPASLAELCGRIGRNQGWATSTSTKVVDQPTKFRHCVWDCIGIGNVVTTRTRQSPLGLADRIAASCQHGVVASPSVVEYPEWRERSVTGIEFPRQVSQRPFRCVRPPWTGDQGIESPDERGIKLKTR